MQIDTSFASFRKYCGVYLTFNPRPPTSISYRLKYKLILSGYIYNMEESTAQA